jgi:hypothetical protein
MSITAMSSTNNQAQFNGSDPMARIKQDFQNLGNALKTGDIDAAKEAYTQLQKDAPAKDGQKDNPIAAQVEAIGKAIDAGDIETAKSAFNKVTETISQRPSMSNNGGKPGGMPSGGAPKSSGSSDSSQSSKSYDKRDSNKDGTVTYQEAILYALKHPGDNTQKQSDSSDSVNSVDTLA